MYEDLAFRREEVQRQLDDGEGPSSILLRQLSLLDRALGNEDPTKDDLFDQWERDLAEGRMPDLDAMPGD